MTSDSDDDSEDTFLAEQLKYLNLNEKILKRWCSSLEKGSDEDITHILLNLHFNAAGMRTNLEKFKILGSEFMKCFNAILNESNTKLIK
eukprot:UN04648